MSKKTRSTRRHNSLGRQSRGVANDLAVAISNARVKAADAEETASQAEPKPLGLKVRNAIRDITDTFLAYAHAFAAVSVKRDEFAPRFVKVFEMWKDETGGGLADFCRLFDETVPTETDDYKKHTTYMAADYLRRKVADARREAEGHKPGRKRVKPASPRVALVRVLGSFLSLLSEDAQAELTTALAKRLHWSDAQAQTLITDAKDGAPVVIVKAPRGVHIEGELRVTLAPETRSGKARAA